MVLSIRSQTFHDAMRDYDTLQSEGKLRTDEEKELFFKSKGTTLDDAKKANNDYIKALEEGETDFRARTNPLNIVPGRQVGRAIGDIIGGVVSFTDAITPGELKDFINDSVNDLPLPESFKKFADEAFDPYHGEGLIAGGEKLVGTLGSYLFPSTIAMKGLGLTGKLLTPAARSNIARSALKVDKTKRRQFVNDEVKRISGPQAQIKRAAAQGTTIAGTTTIVENPDDNIVNTLVEVFPESTQYLERLAVDPDDSEAEQYLNSFIGNLGFGALFSPLVLANAYKKPLLEASSLALKPAGEALSSIGSKIDAAIPSSFNSLIDSRRATDNVTLDIILAREAAAEAAEVRAKGSINEFQTSINKYAKDLVDERNNKKDFSKTFAGQKQVADKYKEVEDKINIAFKDVDAVYDKKYREYINKKADGEITPDIQRKAAAFANQEAKRIQLEGLKGLPKDLQSKISLMVDDVTKLSEQVSKNSKGNFQAKVDGRLGVHLTRSYKFFDDPKFKNNLLNQYDKFKKNPSAENDPDGVFTAAVGSLKDLVKPSKEMISMHGEDQAKTIMAHNTLNKLLGKETKEKANKVLRGLVQNKEKRTNVKQGTTSSISGLDRKNIPENIQALLGREDDFAKNYRNTMINISRMNAETKAADELAEHLNISKLAVEKGTEGAVNLGKISDERLKQVFGKKVVKDKEVQNALSDIYVTKEYADLYRDGLNEMTREDGPLFGAFLKAKGLSQAMKTIYSPVTHGRNIIGNFFLMGANGMVGPKEYQSAAKLAYKNFRTGEKGLGREGADYFAKLKELGIVGQNVDLGVIKRNLGGFSKNPAGYIDNILDHEIKGKSVKGAHKKTAAIYQAEDDVFKIAHFEKIRSQLAKSKTYGKLSPEELDKVAANYTRDLMPNYALVPKAIKGLRYSALGDFLSFPAEMIRVSKNLGMYTLRDIASGDPVLAAMGAKRLAGMTVIGMGTDMLSDYSRNLVGIDDKQEMAINNTFAPSWERNTDRIYLSDIYEDKNGHLGVDYMNLGYIDPFTYIKKMSRGVNELVMGGVFDEDIGNQNLNRIALGTLQEVASPFLAPSMLTDALVDVYNGVKRGDGLSDVIAPAVDVFTPGILSTVNKSVDYYRQMNKLEDTGLQPTKKGGFTSVEGEVDIPAALGLKRQRMDFTASTRFKLNPTLNNLNKINSDYNRYLSDPNIFSTEDTYNKYVDSQKEQLKELQDLRSVILDYKDLFGDNAYMYELNKGMTMGGAFDLDKNKRQYIQAADRNMFLPYQFKPTKQTRFLGRSPLDYNAMYQTYNDLQGTQLLED